MLDLVAHDFDYSYSTLVRKFDKHWHKDKHSWRVS